MNGLGRSHTVDLKKGGKITLYVSVDIYEYDGTDDITDTVSVAYLGYVPAGTGGVYEAKVDALNSYVSEFEASDFVLTALNGDEISIDGGKTWHSSVQLSVVENGSVTYHVKSASGGDTVQVKVDRIAYEFTLNVGTQTQTMIPGKEYTVFLRGTADDAHYVSYILAWNSSDLTVSFGGAPITSGGTVDRYSEYYSLVMIYNGPSAADIEFTLTDPYVPDSEGGATGDGTSLQVGHNAIRVTVNNYYCAGTTVVFTAETAGTYILSPADGELNASVVVSDEYISETVTMPYLFTLEAGQSVEFTVFTTEVMSLTEDTIDLVITKK
jgi:hypothetical protein